MLPSGSQRQVSVWQYQQQRRHDISDRVWKILEPLLPGGKGKVGRPAQSRLSPCRDTGITGAFSTRSSGFCALAPLGGTCPRTTATGRTPPYQVRGRLIVATPADRRYSRWRDNGAWAQLLEAVIDDPDFAWLMIDASHVKAHPHAAGAVGGNQALARTKGG